MRRQRWDDLPRELPDELLAELIPQALYDDLPTVLAEWYDGLADGLNLSPPAMTENDEQHDSELRRLVERPRSIPSRSSAPKSQRQISRLATKITTG